jgi:hypothetical protein
VSERGLTARNPGPSSANHELLNGVTDEGGEEICLQTEAAQGRELEGHLGRRHGVPWGRLGGAHGIQDGSVEIAKGQAT